MPSWSGLWDRQYGTPYTSIGVALGFTENTSEFNSGTRDRLAKLLRNRGERVLARLAFTLMGVVPGTTATEALSQLTSSSGLGDPLSNGGRRTVASVNLVNRATTSADQTYIRSILTQIFGPVLVSGYPTDRGGGGGGKVGGF